MLGLNWDRAALRVALAHRDAGWGGGHVLRIKHPNVPSLLWAQNLECSVIFFGL